MKYVIIALCLFSSTMVKANNELVEKLVGNYKAVDNCAFETASLKIKNINGSRIMLISLKNNTTQGINLHSIDLDNLWTKVRTTRGMARIIKQDRIQGSTILAEEKSCLPGWISCNEWTTKAEITFLDTDTIEARLSENDSPCIFKRTL